MADNNLELEKNQAIKKQSEVAENPNPTQESAEDTSTVVTATSQQPAVVTGIPYSKINC